MSLLDGFSYLVRDPAQGNKLVAVRLAYILHRNGKTKAMVANGTTPKENGKEKGKGRGKEQHGGEAFSEERGENAKVHRISSILHLVEAKASWLVMIEGRAKRRDPSGGQGNRIPDKGKGPRCFLAQNLNLLLVCSFFVCFPFQKFSLLLLFFLSDKFVFDQ